MKRRRTLVQNYRISRAHVRRLKRLVFMSPAEAKFVRIMGGMTITLNGIKTRKTGFPLTIVWMGRYLRSENVSREVRVHKFYVDFGTDIMRAIEIDGNAYHQDIIADSMRDDFLYEHGWLVKRIPAWRLWREPDKVREEVHWFLTK